MYRQLVRRSVTLLQGSSSIGRSNILPKASRAAALPTVFGTLSSSSSPLAQFTFRNYRDAAEEREEEEELKLAGITVARSKGGQSGYCYGCGADLVKGQTGTTEAVKKAVGFWKDKDHDLKKAKIKNWALCPRCKTLRKMDEAGELQNVDLYSPDSKMTEVFRREVSKIRTKEDVVVVLCCDAVNVNGSLIKGIRKYVGGNPILLAVTRCDLLPDYVWKDHSPAEIKEIFRERAQDIIPADVYLCSEEKDMLQNIGGIQRLSMDLWKHLDGRDLYVVGVANIGKSTLTDILISGFVNKGEELRHFHDRLGFKRVQKLREIRITKSSLPGTTLQNVRVPCFKDHNQALWDTPGLLVDTSLKQFPIRNFRSLRAQRPKRIKPHFHVDAQRKSLALLISEKGDDTPLMRMEIRLKKSAEGEGPIRLVWNSILDLDTKVVSIEEAHEEEVKRMQEQKEREEKDDAYWKEKKKATEAAEAAEEKDNRSLTPEEKARKKEEKKRAIEEQIRKEKAELGHAEWTRREKAKKAESEEKQRSKMLAQLTKIHECVLERGVGKDLSVANFGWLGVLVPRTAMIRTFAPKTGIQITEYKTLALPGEFYDENVGRMQDLYGSDDDSLTAKDDDDDDDDQKTSANLYDENYDFGEYSDFNAVDDFDSEPFDEFMDDGTFSSDDGFDFSKDGSESESRKGYFHSGKKGGKGREEESAEDRPRRPSYWEDYSGANVGYQFDKDMRWNDKIEDGWNPIRKTSEEYKKLKEMQDYDPEDFPAKDHSKYYDNPLEF